MTPALTNEILNEVFRQLKSQPVECRKDGKPVFTVKFGEHIPIENRPAIQEYLDSL